MTNSYFDGLREGIRRYAWWKDGTEYVGCGVRTLSQALRDIDDEEAAQTWNVIEKSSTLVVKYARVVEEFRGGKSVRRITEYFDPQSGEVVEKLVEEANELQENEKANINISASSGAKE